MSTADVASVLIDGPPARVPERVREDSVLRGRRVVVNGDGEWFYDIRAVEDPYWYDEDTRLRWPVGGRVPAGADADRARLFVSACRERDWYEWARTKRRPEIREYPAYLVWAE